MGSHGSTRMNAASASKSGTRRPQAMMAAVLLACAWLAPPSAVSRETPPRERISINTDWRFQRGDPDGITHELDYDSRPQVIRSEDGKVADARPEEAAKVAPRTKAVLKPWILPAGNAFIRDRARWHERPAGDPGGTVAFVRTDYDDSTWQRVTLPHDWAFARRRDARVPSSCMQRRMDCRWRARRSHRRRRKSDEHIAG